MTTSTRFDLKFFRILLKLFNSESFIVLFFTWKVSAIIFIGEGLALLLLQNILKLLKFDNLFSPLQHPH